MYRYWNLLFCWRDAGRRKDVLEDLPLRHQERIFEELAGELDFVAKALADAEEEEGFETGDSLASTGGKGLGMISTKLASKLIGPASAKRQARETGTERTRWLCERRWAAPAVCRGEHTVGPAVWVGSSCRRQGLPRAGHAKCCRFRAWRSGD